MKQEIWAPDLLVATCTAEAFCAPPPAPHDCPEHQVMNLAVGRINEDFQLLLRTLLI